jgi:hypothetical protein
VTTTAPATPIDGFYCGYFAGKGGEGIAMFALRRGKLVGADAFGVKFLGNYHLAEDEGEYRGKVSVDAPPNGTLVQGVSSGPYGVKYEVDIALPADFTERSHISLRTPLGTVNVKMVFISPIND